jgi:hypothetical protein
MESIQPVIRHRLLPPVGWNRHGAMLHPMQRRLAAPNSKHLSVWMKTNFNLRTADRTTKLLRFVPGAAIPNTPATSFLVSTSLLPLQPFPETIQSVHSKSKMPLGTA